MAESAAVSKAMTTGKKLGVLTGLVVIALGLVVLIGWISGSEDVITALDLGPAMSEKAALAFIFAGIGILALCFERPRLVIATGLAILFVVGIANERIPVLGRIGISVSSYVNRLPPDSGVTTRMAPYTSVVFLLVGFALLTHAKKAFRRKAAILGLFGPLMMALPTASIICWLVGVLPQDNGGLGGMAFHTSIGLLIAGLGITAIEYSSARKRIVKWWPVILAVFIIVVVLVVWQALLGVPATAESILPDGILIGGIALSAITSVLGYLVQTTQRALAQSEAAKAALHESNETLERRVRERTAELTRKNAELDRFSAVAAHDLKSPVASMVSFAEVIADDLGEANTGDTAEFLKRIQNSGHRAIALIDGLLEMARTGSKRPTAIVDAGILFDQALINLQSSIQSSGARVTSEKLPRICGDEVQILQLLQNLVANALKFRKPGEAPVISVGVDEQDGHWLFRVTDNGIGIDPKDSGKVFEMFGRANGAQTYEGTGLGLAVCRKIVEVQGGQIWFDSQIGRGTVFYFTVPKFEKSPCAEKAEKSAKSPEKGPVSLPDASM